MGDTMWPSSSVTQCCRLLFTLSTKAFTSGKSWASNLDSTNETLVGNSLVLKGYIRIDWQGDVVDELNLERGYAGLVAIHHFHGPVAHGLLQVTLREELAVDEKLQWKRIDQDKWITIGSREDCN